MVCPLCDVVTGDFKGLEEAIGLICIKGDSEEVFFRYRDDKSKSKVLNSLQKTRIPNEFSGTLLTKDKTVK